MLQIIKETYGDKLSQAYSKEGLFIEESVVMKIIYNMLLKDQDGYNFYQCDDRLLWDMLRNIQPRVLKIYDNYDELKLKNDCIVYMEAAGFFEFYEKLEKITDKLKDEQNIFF